MFTLRRLKITTPTPRRVAQPQGKQLEKKYKILLKKGEEKEAWAQFLWKRSLSFSPYS